MTTWIVASLIVLAFAVLTVSRLYKVFMDDTLADLWEFPDPDSDGDVDGQDISEEQTEGSARDYKQGEKQQ
jgi:hypothetical protein